MEHIKQHSLPVELMRVKGDEQTRVFFYKDGDEIKSCYVEMVMHLTDSDSELNALIKSDGRISTSMRLVESGCEDQRSRGFKERGHEVLGNRVSYRGSVKQAIEELHAIRTQINRNMEHLERQVGDVDRQLALLEDALEA